MIETATRPSTTRADVFTDYLGPAEAIDHRHGTPRTRASLGAERRGCEQAERGGAGQGGQEASAIGHGETPRAGAGIAPARHRA